MAVRHLPYTCPLPVIGTWCQLWLTRVLFSWMKPDATCDRHLSFSVPYWQLILPCHLLVITRYWQLLLLRFALFYSLLTTDTTLPFTCHYSLLTAAATYICPFLFLTDSWYYVAIYLSLPITDSCCYLDLPFSIPYWHLILPCHLPIIYWELLLLMTYILSSTRYWQLIVACPSLACYWQLILHMTYTIVLFK